MTRNRPSQSREDSSLRWRRMCQWLAADHPPAPKAKNIARNPAWRRRSVSDPDDTTADA